MIDWKRVLGGIKMWIGIVAAWEPELNDLNSRWPITNSYEIADN
jgi:hypothetical protein